MASRCMDLCYNELSLYGRPMYGSVLQGVVFVRQADVWMCVTMSCLADRCMDLCYNELSGWPMYGCVLQ